MSNPKVSVIIPSYNHGKFIEQCIDSVYAQTYANIEVFCMEKSSTDNTFEVMKKQKKSILHY